MRNKKTETLHGDHLRMLGEIAKLKHIVAILEENVLAGWHVQDTEIKDLKQCIEVLYDASGWKEIDRMVEEAPLDGICIGDAPPRPPEAKKRTFAVKHRLTLVPNPPSSP